MSKIHLTPPSKRAKFIPEGAESLNALIEQMGLSVRFQRRAEPGKISVMVSAPGAACTPYFFGELGVCLERTEEQTRILLCQKFPRSTAAYVAAQKEVNDA